MHLEPLVRRAQEGDVKAFVELTRGYQHLAFGSALALIHDLQQAEDVVQEAFLPAWSVPGRFRRFAGIPVCRACSTARRCKSSIQLDGAKD
jgi:DNA-directed RNA polymerase specialized sigma24 family protein